MGYDVYFCSSIGAPCALDRPLDLRGGTYTVGGTRIAELNITYNYAPWLLSVWEGGIRSLYGKTATAVVEEIKRGIGRMDPLLNQARPCNCHLSWDCYWASSQANAQRALGDLLVLAEAVPPDSVLVGD
jgi:hypothetical protein